MAGDPVVLTPHDTDWLKPDECFVASDITFNQLEGGPAWRQFASTGELLTGLHNRSLDYGADVRVTIHARLVQPILDVTLLFLGLPLVLSRQHRNVFVASWVGTRYARSRPVVHSTIAKHIRERVALDHPLSLALDVGCGTGHSTEPLRSFVEFVVGIDASAGMLAEAPTLEGVAFSIALAEALPLRSGTFDLVSIGLAYHWCDAERFLAEAARVLRSNGWLVVYDSGLVGGSPESEAGQGAARPRDPGMLRTGRAAPGVRQERGAFYAATQRRRARDRPGAGGVR